MLEKLVSPVGENRRGNGGMPVETLVEVDRRWWQVEETSLPLIPYSSATVHTSMEMVWLTDDKSCRYERDLRYTKVTKYFERYMTRLLVSVKRTICALVIYV